MTTYKIIRFRFKGINETIKTGLTLEESQKHCNDPKTENKTGPEETWFFDGYTTE